MIKMMIAYLFPICVIAQEKKWQSAFALGVASHRFYGQGLYMNTAVEYHSGSSWYFWGAGDYSSFPYSTSKPGLRIKDNITVMPFMAGFGFSFTSQKLRPYTLASGGISIFSFPKVQDQLQNGNYIVQRNTKMVATAQFGCGISWKWRPIIMPYIEYKHLLYSKKPVDGFSNTFAIAIGLKSEIF